MDASLLRQIVTNTEPKHVFSFIVSGNVSQILTRFNPPTVWGERFAKKLLFDPFVLFLVTVAMFFVGS